VLVTGGASGIGKGIALMFAKAGADIAIWDLQETEAEKVVSECKALGVDAKFFKANVANEQSVEAAKESTLAHFGNIDFLISNAGVPPNGDLTIMGEGYIDDFRRVMDVNAIGFICMLKAFKDNFEKQGSGKIVVTSSISAKLQSMIIMPYGASKVAVSKIMRDAAVLMGQFNVNVNAIVPGYVYTPLYDPSIQAIKDSSGGALDELAPEDVVAQLATNSALGRVQTEEDMANAVLFLCSDEAKNITGQELVIDAGATVM
jgi:NAD(P)-dependent dehydrogenase (short-subunit alcohol dehydrogenase family)